MSFPERVLPGGRSPQRLRRFAHSMSRVVAGGKRAAPAFRQPPPYSSSEQRICEQFLSVLLETIWENSQHPSSQGLEGKLANGIARLDRKIAMRSIKKQVVLRQMRLYVLSRQLPYFLLNTLPHY